jgi:DNA-binding transcriptional ArsR family regulator
VASRAERALADVDAVFAAVFAALAHASRRQLLLVLHYRGDEMTAGEIAARFDCTWPTTTRHLGILVDAGLVEKQQRGRQPIYRLDRARLASVAQGWLARFGAGE